MGGQWAEHGGALAGRSASAARPVCRPCPRPVRSGRFRHKRLDPDAISAVRWTAEDGWERILPPEFPDLERIEQVSDFHCVTTWSIRGVTWSGRRFRDVFEAVTADGGPRPDAVRFVVFNGFDGYRSILALEDLLATTCCWPTGSTGARWGWSMAVRCASSHRALRLQERQAPAPDCTAHVTPGLPLPAALPRLDGPSPRARRAEERAVGLPNWLVRFFYKLFVPRAVR
jgi:hypothetical protein